MARSASASNVVAIAAVLASLGACRMFVDLDGLGGGGAQTDDGGGTDATTPPDTSSDAAGDVIVDDADLDAPLDVNPDVDASMPCPTGKGPTMIRIPTGNGSFCIDTTEVTNKQYNQFIADSTKNITQDAFCTWNTDFTPKGGWPYAAPTDDQIPVGFVNWCDAAAFCKWAGKRLCGKIGVGAVDGGTGGAAMSASEWANNLINEYTYACSRGGTRVYPYGNAFDNTKCNGGTGTAGVIEAVKTRLTCESGWGGVFDLAGNVHEWANGCVVGADPKTDGCALQDSAAGHADVEMTCTSWFALDRSAVEDEVGFRCCAD
jgi:formylglycine-generating enzyme